MTTPVAGILLAGGMSRRMGGGDKCLRLLGGRTILTIIVERVIPQVSALVLNANGDPARFADFGLPVVSDVIPGNAGPLAGVLTGMSWARDMNPDAEWVATFATDAPFLPLDLVDRLQAAVARSGLPIACATSKGRAHPVFALWKVDLADDLRAAITVGGLRKIDEWTKRHGVEHVEFVPNTVDPFFNVNRPDDLAEAEKLLAHPC